MAQIDTFLIRATYHTIMATTTLRDLSLDTAVPQSTGQSVAAIVEQCRCPPGYTGLSCEVSGVAHAYGLFYMLMDEVYVLCTCVCVCVGPCFPSLEAEYP